MIILIIFTVKNVATLFIVSVINNFMEYLAERSI